MAGTPTDAIKERVDIVALVSESVPLKRAGSNFKARCPFHTEDTPSFVVSPSRQTFHCFGCGAAGDCFSWLMKKEGMSFPEALRVLAQRAGVPLTFERPERRDERERLRGTVDLAAAFYHRILLETAAGQDVRAYLEGRGISRESIRQWRLGFCPEAPTGIEGKAAERGIAADDLVRVGVLYRLPERTFEFFHGRVLFPLADVHGSVVGLAGRVFAHGSPPSATRLSSSKSQAPRDVPKYINSPETPLYAKGKVLYGLDQAKEAIRKENLAVLVEGYTDVIASHQVGVTHVVATAGTALTDDHLAILRRFTDRLAFAFDADAAGDAATRRAIDGALAAGFLISVGVLPVGEDPADLALRDAGAWRRVLAEREDVFPFLLRRALSLHPAGTPDGRRAIATDLLPVIGEVRDHVVAGGYVQELAAALHVDPRFVYSDLQQVTRLTSTSPRGVSTVSPATKVLLGTPPADPTVRREERLLTLLVAEPALVPKVAERIPATAFVAPPTRALYAALQAWYSRGHVRGEQPSVPPFSVLMSQLPGDLRQRFSALLLAAEADLEEQRDEWKPAEEAAVLVRELLRASLRRELQARTEELRSADGEERRRALEAIVVMTAKLARVEHITLS